MKKKKVKSLKTELRKLGVQGNLEPAIRVVEDVSHKVLIGYYNDTLLVFALVATGRRLEGFIARVVRCPKCKELIFSEAIDSEEDLAIQATQQATRASVPCSTHDC